MNKLLGYFTSDGIPVLDLHLCDYIQIELSGKRGIGKSVLISKSTFNLVSEFKWYLGKDGYPNSYGTWDRRIKLKYPITMHKLLEKSIINISNEAKKLIDYQIINKKLFIDHINRNKLDNRLSNLRICTPKENSYNTSKRGNKFKGVRKNKNSYSAQITKDGKSYRINDIPTNEQAARIYDIMAEELFGEFAGKNLD